MADLSSPRPTFFAWLIGLGALAIFCAAVYLGHNSLTLRRHAQLRDEFLLRAAGSDTADGLLNDSRFDPILPRSDSARRANALKLVRTLKSVSAEEYAPAAEILAEPRMQVLKNVKEVRADLAGIAGLEDALNKLIAADSDLERSFESVSGQYRLQRTQLQKLLGYPEEALVEDNAGRDNADEADEEVDDADVEDAEDEDAEDQDQQDLAALQMPFYEQGILQGFPEIGGIPDAVPDIKALAPLVQAQGASLNSPPADFANRLEELRKVSGALAERVRSLQAQAEEHEEKADRIEKQIAERRDATQGKLRAAIEALITPPDDAERARLDQKLQSWLQLLTGR